MALAPDSTRSDPSGGMKLAALCDALVKLHKDTCGRGPNNARCFASGNAVVCLFFESLTQAERTLIEKGDIATVAGHREALQRVMADQARDIVAERLGRRVTAATMATDPANELETAIFVLDSPPDV